MDARGVGPSADIDHGMWSSRRVTRTRTRLMYGIRVGPHHRSGRTEPRLLCRTAVGETGAPDKAPQGIFTGRRIRDGPDATLLLRIGRRKAEELDRIDGGTTRDGLLSGRACGLV